MLCGALVFRAWLFKHPAPVDINSVIDNFENRTTVPGGVMHQDLLAEGVYLYDTVGSESVKGKISTTNKYSDITPFTVEWTTCGYDFQWDASSVRWDHVSICLNDRGLFEKQTTEQHEFFRVQEVHTYKCDDRALLVPAAAVKGDSWRSVCGEEGAQTNRTTTVEGMETVSVGSADVATVHIGIDEILTGSAIGTARIDYWFRQADGLVVRFEKSVSADKDTPIGQVKYTETVNLTLKSIEPSTKTDQS